MKSVFALVAVSILFVSCGQGQPAEPAMPAPELHAYANLAQLMRGIPFPNSNIIFDTQTIDPAAPPETGGGGATAQFSSVYGGWQAVENAALAISETANLLKVPGRMCENGRPAPTDNEDFKMFVQGLADAGAAALTAAKAKDLDAMIEVSGTVADACAACHEIYRDKDDNADRCIK
jgi:cytochrome c553